MKEIKDYIEKYTKLLPVGTSISYAEAERRAGEFLTAMATITDWRHAFSEDKIRRMSLQTAVYATELARGTAKTMTENKVTAEASPSYTEARENLEFAENDITYLKTYYEIFFNAHVFYRQQMRNDN